MGTLTIRTDCLERRIMMASHCKPSPAMSPNLRTSPEVPRSCLPSGPMSQADLKTCEDPPSLSDMNLKPVAPSRRFSFDAFESYLEDSSHSPQVSSHSDSRTPSVSGSQTPYTSVSTSSSSLRGCILRQKQTTKSQKTSKTVTFSKFMVVRDFDPDAPVKPRNRSVHGARSH